MHSLKNTFMAVVLLGASYGVFQVITTPSPSMESNSGLIGPITTPELKTNALSGLNPDAAPPTLGSPSELNSSAQTIPSQPRVQLPEATQPSSSSTLAQDSAPPLSDFNSNRDEAGPGNVALGNGSTETVADPNEFDALPSMAGDQWNTMPAEKPNANQFVATTPPNTESRPADHVLLDALKKEIDTPGLNGATGAQTGRQSNEMQTASLPSMTTRTDLAAPSGLGNERSRDDQQQDATNIRGSELRDEHLIAEWPEIEKLVEQRQFKVALGRLTRFFHSSSLSPTERARLMQWLNALAGKVIYSAEHNMFNKPYIVQSGDTLAELAKRWKVPAQLIYNINKQSIGDPANLIEGTELKVVMGTFHGLVDLSENTITLFAKNLYAGQFPISPSVGGQIRDGQFVIANKLPNVSGEANGNPFTIVLENGVEIAAAQTATGDMIGMSRKDAADVFSILSMGSSVSIRR